MMSVMAYHWRVRAMIMAQPRRKMYWMRLVFQDRSLKLNLRENMGSSLTIRMSVMRERMDRPMSVVLLNSKSKSKFGL